MGREEGGRKKEDNTNRKRQEEGGQKEGYKNRKEDEGEHEENILGTGGRRKELGRGRKGVSGENRKDRRMVERGEFEIQGEGPRER